MNRISNQHPHLHFDIISSDIGVNKIVDLKNRMYTDCIYCRPEAVIMYWDSDVSHPSKSYLNS